MHRMCINTILLSSIIDYPIHMRIRGNNMQIPAVACGLITVAQLTLYKTRNNVFCFAGAARNKQKKFCFFKLKPVFFFFQFVVLYYDVDLCGVYNIIIIITFKCIL